MGEEDQGLGHLGSLSSPGRGGGQSRWGQVLTLRQLAPEDWAPRLLGSLNIWKHRDRICGNHSPPPPSTWICCAQQLGDGSPDAWVLSAPRGIDAGSVGPHSPRCLGSLCPLNQRWVPGCLGPLCAQGLGDRSPDTRVLSMSRGLEAESAGPPSFPPRLGHLGSLCLAARRQMPGSPPCPGTWRQEPGHLGPLHPHLLRSPTPCKLPPSSAPFPHQWTHQHSEACWREGEASLWCPPPPTGGPGPGGPGGWGLLAGLGGRSGAAQRLPSLSLSVSLPFSLSPSVAAAWGSGLAPPCPPILPSRSPLSRRVPASLSPSCGRDGCPP